MNTFWKKVLFNIAGIYGVTLLFALSQTAIAFLYAPLIISVIECLVAFILLIPDKTREAAQIMLAACGIVLLIGLGVCSVLAFNFHLRTILHHL